MPPDANLLNSKVGISSTFRDRSNHIAHAAPSTYMLPTFEYPDLLKSDNKNTDSVHRLSPQAASKKRPRSGTLDSPMLGKENLSSASDSSADCDSVFNYPSSSPRGSILKGKRKKMRGSISPKDSTCARNVQFRPAVTVFQMNDEGDHVCTKCENLKDEPAVSSAPRIRSFRNGHAPLSALCKDSTLLQPSSPRFAGASRTNMNIPIPDYSSASHAHNNYVIRHRGAATVAHARSDFADSAAAAAAAAPHSGSKDESCHGQISNSMPVCNGSHQIPAIGSMSISFSTDPSRATILKMSVYIGHGYTADDIVVKAGVNGSQVRVIANKFAPHPTGQMNHVQQFNEKYVLPMSVDPYSIDARVDNHGFLTVEAALMTLNRKETVLTQG
nr:small heat shock protein [Naineris dendritica]